MKKIIVVGLVVVALSLGACSRPFVRDPYKKYTKYSATQLYNKAQTAMRNKNFDRAVAYLEALDGVYPFNRYASRAQLDAIYAYYEVGDDPSTLVAAERYIRLHPRSKDTAYAYYMAGIANFSKGQSWLQKKFNVSPADRDPKRLMEAYASFKMLLDRFPNSRYAKDTRLRVAYIRNLLADHAMRVSDYYFSIDAYVASANRASEVVSHFQGSDQVPRALAMLVKSYRKLKLPKKAAASYALLKANYPHSAAFRSVR